MLRNIRKHLGRQKGKNVRARGWGGVPQMLPSGHRSHKVTATTVQLLAQDLPKIQSVDIPICVGERLMRTHPQLRSCRQLTAAGVGEGVFLCGCSLWCICSRTAPVLAPPRMYICVELVGLSWLLKTKGLSGGRRLCWRPKVSRIVKLGIIKIHI